MASFCLGAPAGTVLEEGIRAATSQLPSQGGLRFPPLTPLDKCRTGMSWELWSCWICAGYLVMPKHGCSPEHQSPWPGAIVWPCTHALHLMLPNIRCFLAPPLNGYSAYVLWAKCFQQVANLCSCTGSLFHMCAINIGISMKPQQLCARAYLRYAGLCEDRRQ